MSRRRFESVTAWLCLIVFGLSHVLSVSGLVVCRDAHGGVRIEIACAKNATGECITSCGDEVDSTQDEQHPCNDTPVQAEGTVAKIVPRVTLDSGIPIQLPCLLPAFVAVAPPRSLVLWACATPERPPDALKLVRSVILLV